MDTDVFELPLHRCCARGAVRC